MDSKLLIERLEGYGADVKNTLERFVDDTELYESCLQAFVDDVNFPGLAEALSARDAQRAFAAAHTIKGVAANLGLQPLLEVVSGVVEPLRAGSFDGVEESCKALFAEREKVAALLK